MAAKPSKKSAKTKKNTIPVQSSDATLVIRKKADKVLSKEQMKFNKNVRQIENLQKKMDSQARMLDEMMDFFREKVVPKQQERSAQKKILIKQLFVYYNEKRKGITKKDKGMLGGILSDLLGSLIHAGERLESDMEKIMRIITDESYKKATKGELDLAKEEAMTLLTSAGIDFDEQTILGAADFPALEEIMFNLFKARAEEEEEEEEEQQAFSSDELNDLEDAYEEAPKHKKTAKQIAQEEKDKAVNDLKKKNIGYIYKQLAKLFHPDLEMDPSKKEEKEVLMKELTQAYQQNDLHTLLSLELKWVQKADNNSGEMADDKLKLYNSVLLEQIRELKSDIEMLSFHPQYQEMMEFIPEFGDLSVSELKYSLNAVVEEVSQMGSTIKILSQDNAASIKEIKSIVEEKERMEEILGSLSFMDEGFGDDDDEDFFLGV